MLTQKRAARKVALNERLNILRLQEDLNEKNCNSCENKNSRLDPTIACDGCDIYTELLKLGNKLTNANKEKRKFAPKQDDAIEEIEVYSGGDLKKEKVMMVTKGFHSPEGFSFRVGDVFYQKKNMQGNKIELVSRLTKEVVLITQHRYYNSMKNIREEDADFVKSHYVCISKFRNKQADKNVYYYPGEEFLLLKEHVDNTYRVLETKDGVKFRVSKDVFYKKMEKKVGK